MNEEAQDAIATLLTVDGKGREAKRKALLTLISEALVSYVELTDEVEGYKKIDGERSSIG